MNKQLSAEPAPFSLDSYVFGYIQSAREGKRINLKEFFPSHSLLKRSKSQQSVFDLGPNENLKPGSNKNPHVEGKTSFPGHIKQSKRKDLKVGSQITPRNGSCQNLFSGKAGSNGPKKSIHYDGILRKYEEDQTTKKEHRAKRKNSQNLKANQQKGQQNISKINSLNRKSSVSCLNSVGSQKLLKVIPLNISPPDISVLSKQTTPQNYQSPTIASVLSNGEPGHHRISSGGSIVINPSMKSRKSIGKKTSFGKSLFVDKIRYSNPDIDKVLSTMITPRKPLESLRLDEIQLRVKKVGGISPTDKQMSTNTTPSPREESKLRILGSENENQNTSLNLMKLYKRTVEILRKSKERENKLTKDKADLMELVRHLQSQVCSYEEILRRCVPEKEYL